MALKIKWYQPVFWE